MHRAICLLSLVFTGLSSASSNSGKIYVSLRNAPAAVSRINATNGAVSENFPSITGAEISALSPDGSELYVLAPSNVFEGCGCGNNTVSIYRLPSGTLTHTIALPSSPWQIDFAPNGATAFVVASDDTTTALRVFAIDAASGTVRKDVSFPNLYGPSEIAQSALSPDGQYLYVPTSMIAGNVDEVAVLSTSTLTLVNSFPADVGVGLAASPDGKYLVSASSPLLTVYDAKTFAGVAQVSVGDDISLIAVSPDSAHAYVTAFSPQTEQSSVQILDLSTFQLSTGAVVTSAASINNFVISPDGTKALAANELIDLTSQTVIVPAVSTLSAEIYGQFTPDGSGLWVLNQGSSEIAVIDPSTNTVTDAILSPPSPGWLAPGAADTLDIKAEQLAIASFKSDKVIQTVSLQSESLFAGPPDFIAAAGQNIFIASSESLFSFNLSSGKFTTLQIPGEGYPEITAVSYMVAAPATHRLYLGTYELSAPPDANSIPTYDGFLAYDSDTGALLYTLNMHAEGAIAISPDSHTAYVNTLFETKGDLDSITVIDLQSAKVTGIFPVTNRGGFRALAVSPDGRVLYGLDTNLSAVEVFDTATLTETTSFPAPSTSESMALTIDGSEIFLSNKASAQLTVINTATGSESTVQLASASTFVAAAN